MNSPNATKPNLERASSRDVADTTSDVAGPERDLSAPEEPTAKTEPPVVLVVHASVGSGHRSAANAIAQAFDLLKEGADESMAPKAGSRRI